MTGVLVVKAFQGVVETVELHPTEESAWGSLREYVGAPPGSKLNDWWLAWVSPSPPDWYNHDKHGDCRVLHACGEVEGTPGSQVFRQTEMRGSR